MTFKCKVHLPQPYELRWKFNGGSLPNNARVYGNELDVNNIRHENAGYYTCEVEGQMFFKDNKGQLVVIG